MTQRLFCLCALCALLFVLSTANVAVANDDAAPAACPCGISACPYGVAASPCAFANPCFPPASYRVGPFGVVRPVAFAPVYRPVYTAPRYYYAPFRAVYPAVGCPPYAW